MSEVVKKPYGFTVEELGQLETVYKEDLFKGKVVLVSGAGSGLGQAIAFLFGRLGAKLFICGRDPEKLAATEQALKSLGVEVRSKSMTIRDAEQVSALINDVWEGYGQLDVQVNNAGGQFPQAALDFKVKGWQAVIDTNLNGTWYMMQSAAKRWVEEGQPGSIINIVADFWRGMPGIAHTCAARAGVTYLSKSVAVEWAPHNIRVNCVAPGCVETPGFNVYPEEGSATFAESNPMRETGDAQDIAESCVYLASNSGKFITGEVITVDGGQQMWGDPWPIGRPDYFKL
ncbi:MAG: SDR family oxidoreductase [Gammaproteobacteria bacterium]|nr:SDR family oxidoreductase [Gammaproteobacteria bacterium]